MPYYILRWVLCVSHMRNIASYQFPPNSGTVYQFLFPVCGSMATSLHHLCFLVPHFFSEFIYLIWICLFWFFFLACMLYVNSYIIWIQLFSDYFWGLLYGTDLNSLNLFCDIIFSLMRKICYTQYINYKKNKSCKVTRWWSGSAYIVVDVSILMQNFYFLSCRMYELT